MQLQCFVSRFSKGSGGNQSLHHFRKANPLPERRKNQYDLPGGGSDLQFGQSVACRKLENAPPKKPW